MRLRSSLFWTICRRCSRKNIDDDKGRLAGNEWIFIKSQDKIDPNAFDENAINANPVVESEFENESFGE